MLKTYPIDPEKIEAAITPRTTVILPGYADLKIEDVERICGLVNVGRLK